MQPDRHIVIIAGGHGALGQIVVPAFIERGSRVIVVDRHPSDVRGGLGIGADVTDEADIQRAVEEVRQRAGSGLRADQLGRRVCHRAGPGHRYGALAAHARDESDLSVSVVEGRASSHDGTRYSRIIHVAARAAVDPFPGAAAYIVAKAGLAALIKTLALETAGTGITVNGILPTTIDTPANRISMPDADWSTWVQPESIARLLLFLASPEAGQLNGALVPIG